jgi:hypothetical protein
MNFDFILVTAVAPGLIVAALAFLPDPIPHP